MNNPAKILNHIINPFLTLNDENAMYINAYYTNNGIIYINNEICFINNHKGLFIDQNNQINLVVTILNLLPEIKAEIKSNTIFINGIEWDGKKVNLNLFK